MPRSVLCHPFQFATGISEALGEPLQPRGGSAASGHGRGAGEKEWEKILMSLVRKEGNELRRAAKQLFAGPDR